MITDSFDDDLAGAGTQPFLVDFRVQGCGPCKALAPVLEEVAAEQADRLKVGTVQLENAPELAVAVCAGADALVIFNATRERFGD
ncbi:thioredoxin family protein [Nonomuraea basaltis]|uniref:thioredoxin family protein n=1 Tax=Nonomuraea basaltis TaxID=2495887 RepID=UPI00197E05D7|nr:thioredoxin domain-containing protein [Nonomuraea basaltis]